MAGATFSRRVWSAFGVVVIALTALVVGVALGSDGDCDDGFAGPGCIEAPDLGPDRDSQDVGDAKLAALEGLGGGGVSAEAAVRWARDHMGSSGWAGWCLKFTANAYGMDAAGFYDAITAAREIGVRPEPARDAPTGALLFFGPHESNWGHGHVGLSLGDGTMISATATVRVDDVSDPYWSQLYLGWAYPPESWSPVLDEAPSAEPGPPETTTTTALQGSAPVLQAQAPSTTTSTIQGSSPVIQGPVEGDRGQAAPSATSPPAPSTTPTPTPTPTTTAPPPTTAAPPPTTAAPPPTKEYSVSDYFFGGTWLRSDPNDGGWYRQNNPPANGRSWLSNGTSISVVCAASRAEYEVKWADGRSETWSWWAQNTDGGWVPTATLLEGPPHDGNPGVPDC